MCDLLNPQARPRGTPAGCKLTYFIPGSECSVRDSVKLKARRSLFFMCLLSLSCRLDLECCNYIRCCVISLINRGSNMGNHGSSSPNVKTGFIHKQHVNIVNVNVINSQSRGCLSDPPLRTTYKVMCMLYILVTTRCHSSSGSLSNSSVSVS